MPSFISLDAEGLNFEFEGIQLSVASYGAFIKEEIRKWSTFFKEKILLGADLRIDVKQLTDNRSDKSPLFNFTKDSTNRPAHWSTVLMTKWAQTELGNEFVCDDNTWNIGRIKNWATDYNRYKKWTGAIFEWSLGMPARGEEMMTIRHANGVNSESRNIYKINERICVFLGYNKTNNITNQQKPILRVMPPAVGEIIAVELMAVQSIHHLFLTILHQHHNLIHPTTQRPAEINQSLLSNYFTNFDGQKIQASAISLVMQSATKETFKKKMGLADNRQIMCLFGKKMAERKNMIAAQAGHSALTSHTTYGNDDGHIPELSHMTLQEFYFLSQEIHILLGLDERNPTERYFSFCC